MKYSKNLDSLPMRMWRSMVVLLVSVVGKCCGRLKCLRTCMGWRLNLTWLKLRIPRLIMNRKNLLQRNIQTSSCKTNAKRYRIIFASVLCLFTCCTFYTEKTKMSFIILPECWCVPIVVMWRNKFGDDIPVDTWWFRMLWWHSNTVYQKIGCICGELWRTW